MFSFSVFNLSCCIIYDAYDYILLSTLYITWKQPVNLNFGNAFIFFRNQAYGNFIKALMLPPGISSYHRCLSFFSLKKNGLCYNGHSKYPLYRKVSADEHKVNKKNSLKQWCGPYAYQKKGERLCRTNKIHFTRFDAETNEYTAEVNGTDGHEVQLTFDWDGKPKAQCTCPSLSSFETFCQHIAAVLIRLYDIQQAGESPAPLNPANVQPGETPESIEHVPIAERILGLFDDKPIRPIHNRTLAETRTPLAVEFILKLLAFNKKKTALFGIEVKVGPKALYFVRNIASFFLDQLVRGEGYPLSPKFSYDPELHSFSRENEAVLRALFEIVQDRAAYRQTDRLQPNYASIMSGDRTLLVPPQAWTGLLHLLTQAPKVTIMDGDNKYDGICYPMKLCLCASSSMKRA